MRWAGTTQVRGRIRHGNLQKGSTGWTAAKRPARASKAALNQWNHAVAAAALARFLGGEHDGAPPMQQAPPCAKQARTYPRKRKSEKPARLKEKPVARSHLGKQAVFGLAGPL